MTTEPAGFSPPLTGGNQATPASPAPGASDTVVVVSPPARCGDHAVSSEADAGLPPLAASQAPEVPPTQPGPAFSVYVLQAPPVPVHAGPSDACRVGPSASDVASAERVSPQKHHPPPPPPPLTSPQKPAAQGPPSPPSDMPLSPRSPISLHPPHSRGDSPTSPPTPAAGAGCRGGRLVVIRLQTARAAAVAPTTVSPSSRRADRARPIKPPTFTRATSTLAYARAATALAAAPSPRPPLPLPAAQLPPVPASPPSSVWGAPLPRKAPPAPIDAPVHQVVPSGLPSPPGDAQAATPASPRSAHASQPSSSACPPTCQSTLHSPPPLDSRQSDFALYTLSHLSASATGCAVAPTLTPVAAPVAPPTAVPAATQAAVPATTPTALLAATQAATPVAATPATVSAVVPATPAEAPFPGVPAVPTVTLTPSSRASIPRGSMLTYNSGAPGSDSDFDAPSKRPLVLPPPTIQVSSGTALPRCPRSPTAVAPAAGAVQQLPDATPPSHPALANTAASPSPEPHSPPQTHHHSGAAVPPRFLAPAGSGGLADAIPAGGSYATQHRQYLRSHKTLAAGSRGGARPSETAASPDSEGPPSGTPASTPSPPGNALATSPPGKAVQVVACSLSTESPAPAPAAPPAFAVPPTAAVYAAPRVPTLPLHWLLPGVSEAATVLGAAHVGPLSARHGSPRAAAAAAAAASLALATASMSTSGGRSSGRIGMSVTPAPAHPPVVMVYSPRCPDGSAAVGVGAEADRGMSARDWPCSLRPLSSHRSPPPRPGAVARP